MAQVTYNGEVPVLTPSLAAEGDVSLGLWQPGETKDVPQDLVEGLCAPGGTFSSAGDQNQDQAPSTEAEAEDDEQADQDQDEKPRRSFLARARGTGEEA